MVFSYGVALRIWSEQGILQRELAPYLLLKERKKNLEIVFFTYETAVEKQYLPAEIELVAMGKYWERLPRVFKALYSLLLPIIYYKKFSQCHVLKTNQIWGSWLALMASFLTRNKLWVRAGYEHYTNHLLRNSVWYKKFISFLVSLFAYQNADLITVTTKEMADFISQRFLISGKIISVHGNYIDTEIFKPITSVKSRRVLFVGRLNIHKNIEMLMHACSDLKLGLTLVGHGEYQSQLQKLQEELNSDVRFISSIPNHQLPQVYSEHFIFCLPSLFEGNPKVILEAMSCASAVIGNNVRGIKELIENNVDGLLFESDLESLKSALSLLSQDEILRSQLGLMARKKIIDSYSLQSFIKFEEDNLSILGIV